MESDLEAEEPNAEAIGHRLALARKSTLRLGGFLAFLVCGLAFLLWRSTELRANFAALPLGRGTSSERRQGKEDHEVGIVRYSESRYSEGSAGCSTEDYGFLDDLRRGDPQPFFYSISECAKHSITWTLSFDEGGFIGCLKRNKYISPLSNTCMNCYLLNGLYAFNNCRFQCMASWCSQSCLNCTAQNDRAFSTCSGRPPYELPRARAC
uniref:Uncharacterized protein n=1 Tax=Alexandrium catenella TaxID=2925 RepID=A0A7S1SCL5_ALECA|mmetsp:Transcript_95753/g.254264  ORF Transcript_95753/g.254264 Transcript_95753/m.254264 type:complete len:209 (+) Transcript_95753:2-628(+)